MRTKNEIQKARENWILCTNIYGIYSKAEREAYNKYIDAQRQENKQPVTYETMLGGVEYHVIYSDTEHAYWNNKDGWIDNWQDADIYTLEEKKKYADRLPVGCNAKWLSVTKMKL